MDITLPKGGRRIMVVTPTKQMRYSDYLEIREMFLKLSSMAKYNSVFCDSNDKHVKTLAECADIMEEAINMATTSRLVPLGEDDIELRDDIIKRTSHVGHMDPDKCERYAYRYQFGTDAIFALITSIVPLDFKLPSGMTMNSSGRVILDTCDAPDLSSDLTTQLLEDVRFLRALHAATHGIELSELYDALEPLMPEFGSYLEPLRQRCHDYCGYRDMVSFNVSVIASLRSLDNTRRSSPSFAKAFLGSCSHVPSSSLTWFQDEKFGTGFKPDEKLPCVCNVVHNFIVLVEMRQGLRAALDPLIPHKMHKIYDIRIRF